MKKYIGILISSFLFQFAKLSANNACAMFIYQPLESGSIKKLSNLDK